MSTAEPIPPKSDKPKPAAKRNYDKATPPKDENKVEEAPFRLKRQQLADKAKESWIGLSPDAHNCVRIEYNLPIDHTIEHVEDPAYWSNILYKFTKPIATEGTYVGSIICVRPPDHRFYAEYYITDVDSHGVHVEQILYKEFGPQEVESELYRIQWNGVHRGYDILRKADNAIVVNGAQMKRLSNVVDWLKQWDR